MLDRSTLGPAWSLYNGHYPGELNLRCNSQTVGIYNGAANQWIEYDIRAKKLTIVKVTPLPPPKEVHITGLALTESGGIFASVHDRSKIPPMSGVFKLVRNAPESATWLPVSGSVGPYLRGSTVERIVGASGNDLLYTRQLDGEVFWSTLQK
jgi:hypothetical protein